MPTAILQAFVPTEPPPKITTLAFGVPGTPARRTPEPPKVFSRYLAPSWTLKRPAIWLMGARSGMLPSVSINVS